MRINFFGSILVDKLEGAGDWECEWVHHKQKWGKVVVVVCLSIKLCLSFFFWNGWSLVEFIKGKKMRRWRASGSFSLLHSKKEMGVNKRLPHGQRFVGKFCSTYCQLFSASKLHFFSVSAFVNVGLRPPPPQAAEIEPLQLLPQKKVGLEFFYCIPLARKIVVFVASWKKERKESSAFHIPHCHSK